MQFALRISLAAGVFAAGLRSLPLNAPACLSARESLRKNALILCTSELTLSLLFLLTCGQLMSCLQRCCSDWFSAGLAISFCISLGTQKLSKTVTEGPFCPQTSSTGRSQKSIMPRFAGRFLLQRIRIYVSPSWWPSSRFVGNECPGNELGRWAAVAHMTIAAVLRVS